jgi:agmatinase
MYSSKFLAASSADPLPGKPCVLGCPLDLTCTYRSGVAKAPSAIRQASDSIETYSPFLDKDLLELPFADLGDLDFHGKTLANCLDFIRDSLTSVVIKGAKPLCLGGEHTITLPIVESLNANYNDFVVLHLDAHTDLRDSYEGSSINHATVIRRVSEVVGPANLIQLGIRAGTAEEFQWMRRHGTLLSWEPSLQNLLYSIVAGRPVYLTMDLDVMDPACFPSTGNPEAGGWFYSDFERFLNVIRRLEIIGADFVELNPTLDSSFIGSILAAKIVREILILLEDKS